MNNPTWAVIAGPLLALCIPLIYGGAVPLASPRLPFRAATLAASLALALALLVAASGVFASNSASMPEGVLGTLAGLPRIDAVTRGMLTLVCFIAVVIVRYSRTYLRGDPGQARYARALLATLTAVTTLILASHLIVIALAWMATSLALHKLLTFYEERPEALVAAHKKFLLSRLADGCLLAAIVLLERAGAGLSLDALNASVPQGGAPPSSTELAAVLLVVAASLKSAQLPFHGWLIQVMEAPTPVSALLHAGVVNIGGFVMIRLAPFVTRFPFAQTLLLVIGTITAVVAALVMMTRVSVKVALAWSTCAQMGFMLVECGLGAWNLALLHLFAHSLYKAHAFLQSGTAVDAWRTEAMAPLARPVGLAQALLVSALTSAIVVATVRAAGIFAPDASVSNGSRLPLALILGVSLSPLAIRAMGRGGTALYGIAFRATLVSLLYFGGHALAARVFALPEAVPPFESWLIVIGGLSLLLIVQVVLQCRPDGSLAKALQPRLFAGLYLDEIFTRVTFRVWPPPFSRRDAATSSLQTTATLEVP